MAEGLGIAASIIAISQLTAKVTQYINGVKKAPDSQQKLLDELNSLIIVLSALQSYATANPDSATLCKLNDNDGPLRKRIEELKDLLSKMNRTLTKASTMRRMLKRLKWPLQEKDTSEFTARLGGLKSDFSLALNMDQAVARKLDREKDDALRDREYSGNYYSSN